MTTERPFYEKPLYELTEEEERKLQKLPTKILNMLAAREFNNLFGPPKLFQNHFKPTENEEKPGEKDF